MEKTMTEREILKQAIEKAIGNGYKCKAKSVADYAFWLLNGVTNRANHVIFSHSFAIAYWGTEKVCPKCGADFRVIDEGDGEAWICDENEYHSEWDDGSDNPLAWQYHLQAMVIEPEPLDYLKKFLKNGKEEIKETEIDRINRIARTPFDEYNGNKNRNICSNCGGSGDYHNLNCGLK